MLNEWQMAGHLAAALGFGAAIGLERQWRARMAGLRTNALVAAGSALFVLLSQYGFLSTASEANYDGSRVAAQIVSGIGFLGAGVIMRDGLSVRGLNTAATLWCSAAVGALAGTGLFVLAAFGTAGVVGANLLLRPLGRRLDREPTGGAEVDTDYHFEAVCLEEEEAHIRHKVIDALAVPGYRLHSIHSQDAPDLGRVTVAALLTSEGRNDRMLENAVSNLSLEPSVSAVSWAVVPHSDETADTAPDGRRTFVRPKQPLRR
ncbi:MgtC/SapB family protein [Streptomyces sp. NPDC042898]|uniref:MgtC/SapB family protein n=1 Tax=Streptomyces sp. NPDC042898 TaxID=3154334 RepID=UPI00340E27D5